VRLRSTPALLWMASATVFAMQFRPECVLIAVAVGAIVLLDADMEIVRPRFWAAGAMAFALAMLHIAHLSAVRQEGWGASGPRLSTAFLEFNLSSNGWFYLADGRFPVAYSAL